MKDYSKHFILPTRDANDKARQYLRGLLQAGNIKNIYRMAEVIPDVKSRNLQQFLTHSSWRARELMDHVAHDVNHLLEGHEEIGLFIDESGFIKNGKMSVATARQWLGHLDRVDNGQVAIFGLLASDGYAAPLDCRLFLPEEWARDKKRCQKAGVPKDQRQFYTKAELALKIVAHARENGLDFNWIGADEGYGNSPGFCILLDQQSEMFIVDVSPDFFVYLENPEPYISVNCAMGNGGFNNLKTDAKAYDVGGIVGLIPKNKWILTELIGGAHVPSTVYAVQKPVYIWDGKSTEVYSWRLLATKAAESNEDVKISITNIPNNIPLSRLILMQHRRFWAERIFKNAQKDFGMADYQVRKWGAWHHHMVLVMMAMLLALYRKVKFPNTELPMLAAEIENLLEIFLPRKITDNNVMASKKENRPLKGSDVDSYFYKRANSNSIRVRT